MVAAASFKTLRVLRVVLSHQPRSSSSIRLLTPLLALALCALLFCATSGPEEPQRQPARAQERTRRWLQQTRSHASEQWLRAQRAARHRLPPPPMPPPDGAVVFDSLTALLVLSAIAASTSLVRLGLRRAQPSPSSLQRVPPPTAAELARLPRCATRRGVTDAERAEMLHILRDRGVAHGLALHDGLLALGTVREVLLKPTAVERTRLLRKFARMLAWRERSGADSALSDGLPTALLAAGGQSESWEYGRTTGGLPVFIDQAFTWRDAIAACRKHGVPPSEYGKARIYWHERCLQRARECHAEGSSATGQFVHIIDMGGLDVTWAELKAGWPFVMEAGSAVALHYGGCCARICVARAPALFWVGWRVMQPFLVESTRAKVNVVSPRGRIPSHADYGDEPLTAMPPDSLPVALGGTLTAPLGPMHYCPPPLRSQDSAGRPEHSFERIARDRAEEPLAPMVRPNRLTGVDGCSRSVGASGYSSPSPPVP